MVKRPSTPLPTQATSNAAPVTGSGSAPDVLPESPLVATNRTHVQQIATAGRHRNISVWIARASAIFLLALVCGQFGWPTSTIAQTIAQSQARSRQARETSPARPQATSLPIQMGDDDQPAAPVRSNRALNRSQHSPPQHSPPLHSPPLHSRPQQGLAQVPVQRVAQPAIPDLSNVNVEQWIAPQRLTSSVQVWLFVSVLSLAPAILMMSTCFVRFIVVLSLLRQALGTPSLPPNQVLMGLSLVLTFLVMAPVWNECYQQGLRPYAEAPSDSERPPLDVVFQRTVAPLRQFMSQQIDRAHNADAVWMFVEYQKPAPESPEAEYWTEPETYDDVPLTALLPAYLLSELKTAFLIGFQIYLPFLIIDLVVASTLLSMGLSMLSPGQISLPFKLLLFVLIDGWTLTVGLLLESVRAVT